MATVTSLTAARILEIEAAQVVSARIVNGNLVLVKNQGVEINVGPVGGGGSGGGSANVTAVNVTNPAMARPDAVIVLWIGGTTRPNNMGPLDLWFAEGPPVPVAPTILTTSLTTIAVGTAFYQLLSVSGDAPMAYAVTAGSLPAGLTLNATTGVISGNPTAAAAYNFTVRATNAEGNDTQVYTGTVLSAGVAPAITTTTIAAMTQNVVYNQSLVATGSTPMTWGVISGTLPAGLAVNSSTGVISGTPTGSGAYSFTVQASNAFGNTSRVYSGTITANVVAPVITTTSLGSVVRGTTYSIVLAATGSTPMTFAVTAGTLPAGLSLNTSTGAITGTPTTEGAYSFSVTATNSAGNDPQAYTGNVTAPSVAAPTITTTALNTLTKDSAFTQTIVATGGTPITWSVLSGGLPTGLSLAPSTGIISGTPTVTGPYSFALRATNSGGADDQPYSGSIVAGAGNLSVHGSAALINTVGYTDADSGSWVSQQFYAFGPGGSAAAKIVGARLFVADASPNIGQAWRASLIRTPDDIILFNDTSALLPQSAFNTSSQLTEGVTLVAGWNEILFGLEADGVPSGGAVRVGVQIGNGTRYEYGGSSTGLSVNFIAMTGLNMGLSERGYEEGEGVRAFYQDSILVGSSAPYTYGIDILVRA